MSATSLLATPYKGLMPYEEKEEDAQFFFGREREREIITGNLMGSRLTVLYGASGVGKSSVLRAGVAYRLCQLAQQNALELGTPELAVVVFRNWRDDPIASLTTRIHESVTPLFRGKPFEAVPPLDSLTQTFQAWTDRIGGDLLIILDQFEDYFLYHPQEHGQGTFADEFTLALNRLDLQVSFLISIREDALANLDRRFKGRIPHLLDNRLEIKHLNRLAAKAAIEEPIKQYNRLHTADRPEIGIEPELVEKVLKQVQAGRVILGEAGRGRVEAQVKEAEIETPYLQLVMTRLWHEEMNVGSHTLRLETLRRLGGSERIVQEHLDGAMRSLPRRERNLAARTFRYLITPSGTKIAYVVSDLAELTNVDERRLQQLLEKLSREPLRILRAVDPPPDRPHSSRYEIFHDVLAPAILYWRTMYAHAKDRLRWLAITLTVILALILVQLAVLSLVRARLAEQARKEAAKADNLNSETRATLYEIINSGDLQVALERLEDARQLFEQDGNQAGEGMTLNNIGGIYRSFALDSQAQANFPAAQMNFNEAEDYFLQAREKLKVFRSDHPDVATCLNDLGLVYNDQGSHAEAEPLFNQARDILEKALGQNSRYVAPIIANLAECYRSQGKYAEAEPLYKRALKIRQGSLPPDHADIAQSSIYLAVLYSELGRYDEAERYFDLALKHPNNQEVGYSRNSLGDLYRKQGKFGEARQQLDMALEIDQQNNYKLGVAYDKGKLGLLYYDLGKYGDAEQSLEYARRVLEDGLGPEHPDVASVCSNLALVYLVQSKYDDAEPLFKKALDVQEKALPYHPDLAETLENYADLLRRLNRQDEATEKLARGTQIRNKHAKEDPRNQ